MTRRWNAVMVTGVVVAGSQCLEGCAVLSSCAQGVRQFATVCRGTKEECLLSGDLEGFSVGVCRKQTRARADFFSFLLPTTSEWRMRHVFMF